MLLPVSAAQCAPPAGCCILPSAHSPLCSITLLSASPWRVGGGLKKKSTDSGAAFSPDPLRASASGSPRCTASSQRARSASNFSLH
ncbi:hypothetical protein XELAEV_18042041mg [Xenopus laevis]|uniref:Uncharacterized protein n=1 Tax=Xenopus laevis TaxID=8355 RepID=A0A974H5Q5_XENLA|nr:hypothetical protein XELAEV_18042041mg [Xenopus laevis]